MTESIVWKNEMTTVDDPIIASSSTLITTTMPANTVENFIRNQHNIVSNNASPIHEKTVTALSPGTIASVTSSSDHIYHQSLPNMNTIVSNDSLGSSFSPTTTSMSNGIRAMSFSPSSLQSMIVPSISTSPTTTSTNNQQPTNNNIQLTTTNGTTTLHDNSTTSLHVIPPATPRDPDHGPVGCYMVYESSSSGRLMLYYSIGPVPENSVGFWCPGPTKQIQGFKFKQGLGRSELIKGIAGGDSNRRKYFVGWCQFCKLAKSYHGKIIQFIPRYQGVAVDIYGYNKMDNQPTLLNLDVELTDISMYDAVAVMPKHHEFLKGVKSIGMTQFLELGNIAGATTMMN